MTASVTENQLPPTGQRVTGRERTLLGYGWPWTVRPRETIDFMVSQLTEGLYQADLVRIICGDSISDAKLFKEQEVAAPFAGRYTGRHQPVHTGSYIEIDASPSLDQLDSFTVQTMVLPTALPGSPQKPLPDTPESGLAKSHSTQYLISRWDEQSQMGWALRINQQDQLVFIIGDGKHSHATVLYQPLIEGHWFFVVASYDSNHQCVRLSAKPVINSNAPCQTIAWAECRVEEQHTQPLALVQQGPLRFAACTNGLSNGARLKPAGCFNGRLDKIRLSSGVLDDSQVNSLLANAIPIDLKQQVIGFWDFGQGISTINIVDRSDNQLHGVTVNLPIRAVTGVDWDGSVNDWRQKPGHYSAIHFHDDDLYDAEWNKDFSYCIPEGLPSGIYAVRLRDLTAGQGSEDYIPFFVAAPKGQPTSKVALLLSTTSYTAYTNVSWEQILRKKVTDKTGATQLINKDIFPTVLRPAEDVAFRVKQMQARQLGKGVYLHHTDGSHCNTASQKYPNMTIKPKGNNWTLVADTYITDWLKQLGIEVDIITDDLLQSEGVELLNHYSVVMTGNHPEYCSAQMLDAIAQYQKAGGRWMYMGGNGYFWVTSYHAQLAGAIEVRKTLYPGIHPSYERRNAFDGEAAALWSDNGRRGEPLVGVGSVLPLPFEGSAAYERLPDSYNDRVRFIFDGVEQTVFGDYGIIGDGAAGQETDMFSRELGSPLHALHLARSQDFTMPVTGYQGLVSDEYRSNVPMIRADMAFFETPQGGAVFSVGSMAWVGALSYNHYNNDIARITENVLRRFMDDAPFTMPKHQEGV